MDFDNRAYVVTKMVDSNNSSSNPSYPTHNASELSSVAVKEIGFQTTYISEEFARKFLNESSDSE